MSSFDEYSHLNYRRKKWFILLWVFDKNVFTSICPNCILRKSFILWSHWPVAWLLLVVLKTRS